MYTEFLVHAENPAAVREQVAAGVGCCTPSAAPARDLNP